MDQSILKRLSSPDPVIFWAYTLPLLYWIFLTLTTNLVLVFDSEGYYYWANAFYHGQWVRYFTSGPNREPLYPLMISASMLAGQWTGLAYTYPLKVICFGTLWITMICMQQVLEILNAPRWVQALCICYMGLSPVLINSALCMYSEIATLPWFVAAVLFSYHFLRSLKDALNKNLLPAAGVGFCFLGFTFVKGLGEALAPVYFIWLFWHAWRRSNLPATAFLRRAKFKIMIMLCVFYIPILGFKSLNYHYNGHFSFTNRADIASYGPFMQRAQCPISLTNSLVHLSTIPVNYSMCSHFFSDEQCSYWYKSPDIYYDELQKQLDTQNLSPAQHEKAIYSTIFKTALSHPLRQLVYQVPEGLKMFFWETSQGPFVVYPPSLEKFLTGEPMAFIMAIGGGTFCILGFLIACFFLKEEPVLITFALTVVLIMLMSFFNIINRYAIMAGPLSILLNGCSLTMLAQKFLPRKKS